MKRFSGLQAVAFDVGGTLIDPRPSVGHVYAQVAAEHGFPGLNPEALNKSFKDAWRTKTNFNYSRENWLKLVKKTFEQVDESSGRVSFFSELYERFAHPQVWKIYDDVIPTLDCLKEKGLALAVISNWDDRLRSLLTRLQLDTYFNVLIISAEVGVQKPSREIFKRALEQLGNRPESVLHVGDSPVEDCDGAAHTGLQSILIDRNRTKEKNGCITSLGELKTIIDTTRVLSNSNA